jgi:hypothetical protein
MEICSNSCKYLDPSKKECLKYWQPIIWAGGKKGFAETYYRCRDCSESKIKALGIKRQKEAKNEKNC